MQGLSIGIDALFICAPNVCRGVCLFLARTLYLERITISWCYVVGRDFTINDVVSAFNLTSHNKYNSVEIIGYNPLIRNNNSLNPFIITNNNQLSFNYYISFFHVFYKAANL